METPLDWEIVAEYVYANDINDYYLFVQLQGDKPFCVLQKTDFLRYAKPEYHPNTVQVKAMRKHLQAIMDSQDVEMVLRELQAMIEVDMGIEDILDVGHISAQDKVFVYEINEADYGALNNLFNKP